MCFVLEQHMLKGLLRVAQTPRTMSTTVSIRMLFLKIYVAWLNCSAQAGTIMPIIRLRNIIHSQRDLMKD